MACIGKGGCAGQLQGFGQKCGWRHCRVLMLISRYSWDQSISFLSSHGVGHPLLLEGCLPAVAQ